MPASNLPPKNTLIIMATPIIIVVTPIITPIIMATQNIADK
jgi:hypothetical protein